MRCFLIGFAGFVVAAVVTMVAVAAYGDYASRASLSETIAAMGPLREKIAPDGTIVFRSAKHGQIIVFEPSVRENVVSWRCIGSKPEKNIPPNCR